MQKLLDYPFKDMLSISFISSANELLTTASDFENSKKEVVPKSINNYLKSEREIEAELCLVANVENRSPVADPSSRKKPAGETIHSITTALLLSPDFVEENY